MIHSLLHDLIETVYGGVERPPDAPGQLRAIASYLDRIDDVADDSLGRQDSEHRVNRAMQDDLRRIAELAARASYLESLLRLVATASANDGHELRDHLHPEIRGMVDQEINR